MVDVTMDVPTLVFVSWPEIALQETLCGKTHCGVAKSTCSFRDLVFLNEYFIINVEKLQGRVLCLLFILEKQIC
jgi:hypothetical protein